MKNRTLSLSGFTLSVFLFSSLTFFLSGCATYHELGQEIDYYNEEVIRIRGEIAQLERKASGLRAERSRLQKQLSGQRRTGASEAAIVKTQQGIKNNESDLKIIEQETRAKKKDEAYARSRARGGRVG